MNKNHGPGALLAGKRVYNGRYKVKALCYLNITGGNKYEKL